MTAGTLPTPAHEAALKDILQSTITHPLRDFAVAAVEVAPSSSSASSSAQQRIHSSVIRSSPQDGDEVNHGDGMGTPKTDRPFLRRRYHDNGERQEEEKEEPRQAGDPPATRVEVEREKQMRRRQQQRRHLEGLFSWDVSFLVATTDGDAGGVATSGTAALASPSFAEELALASALSGAGVVVDLDSVAAVVSTRSPTPSPSERPAARPTTAALGPVPAVPAASDGSAGGEGSTSSSTADSALVSPLIIGLLAAAVVCASLSGGVVVHYKNKKAIEAGKNRAAEDAEIAEGSEEGGRRLGSLTSSLSFEADFSSNSGGDSPMGTGCTLGCPLATEEEDVAELDVRRGDEPTAANQEDTRDDDDNEEEEDSGGGIDELWDIVDENETTPADGDEADDEEDCADDMELKPSPESRQLGTECGDDEDCDGASPSTPKDASPAAAAVEDEVERENRIRRQELDEAAAEETMPKASPALARKDRGVNGAKDAKGAAAGSPTTRLGARRRHSSPRLLATSPSQADRDAAATAAAVAKAVLRAGISVDGESIVVEDDFGVECVSPRPTVAAATNKSRRRARSGSLGRQRSSSVGRSRGGGAESGAESDGWGRGESRGRSMERSDAPLYLGSRYTPSSQQNVLGAGAGDGNVDKGSGGPDVNGDKGNEEAPEERMHRSSLERVYQQHFTAASASFEWDSAEGDREAGPVRHDESDAMKRRRELGMDASQRNRPRDDDFHAVRLPPLPNQQDGGALWSGDLWSGPVASLGAEVDDGFLFDRNRAEELEEEVEEREKQKREDANAAAVSAKGCEGG
eukprot:CAMPEP_0171987460 /NCGR_PEP_ID=MMETSP0993-20121228/275400_1 /TAXON_ID=483369 /ORGANISM="non described non described, Strain CCMP2098" /LENGTH=805 /DNA_ID=CAMNT_0012640401 /DNA_START=4 /DNA_END=2418 /DNA_ORIENTATION=-